MATVAEVADWIGLSTRRVKELRADGVLPGASGETYDLKACVTAYCAHIRPASGRSAAGGSDVAPDLDAARIRLLTAQAEGHEMKNAVTRGELIPTPDMETAIGALLDGMRARVLALPTRAAPLVVGLGGLAEVRDTLTGLVHEALTEIASNEFACAKVKDRAISRSLGGGASESAGEASSATS